MMYRNDCYYQQIFSGTVTKFIYLLLLCRIVKELWWCLSQSKRRFPQLLPESDHRLWTGLSTIWFVDCCLSLLHYFRGSISSVFPYLFYELSPYNMLTNNTIQKGEESHCKVTKPSNKVRVVTWNSRITAHLSHRCSVMVSKSTVNFAVEYSEVIQFGTKMSYSHLSMDSRFAVVLKCNCFHQKKLKWDEGVKSQLKRWFWESSEGMKEWTNGGLLL